MIIDPLKQYLVKPYTSIPDRIFNFIDENLLEIHLRPHGEKRLNNHEYQVELNFTLDGLLGLGSELIRQAINAKQEGDKPIVYPQYGEPYFYRGVHLTEDSPNLVPLINDKLELNTITQQIHKIRQKKAPLILSMPVPFFSLLRIDYVDKANVNLRANPAN